MVQVMCAYDIYVSWWYWRKINLKSEMWREALESKGCTINGAGKNTWTATFCKWHLVIGNNYLSFLEWKQNGQSSTGVLSVYRITMKLKEEFIRYIHDQPCFTHQHVGLCRKQCQTMNLAEMRMLRWASEKCSKI